MIILIVKPSRDDGLKTYSTRGRGYVGGRLVVSRSRSRCSMLAGFLPARGSISQRVVMRHAGHDHGALGSTVGAAAKLTVVARTKSSVRRAGLRYTTLSPQPGPAHRGNPPPTGSRGWVAGWLRQAR
jgi:hypothetical protein